MDKIAKLIQSGEIHNIIVMVGAGISVASGIPDFRSPKVGVYSSIEKIAELHDKEPTFVFDMDTFENDPRPFWWMFSKIWPATSAALPTPFHFLIRLFNDHGMLLRCYTQNIDCLEEIAGLDPRKIIHAHGQSDTCHCMKCNKEYSISFCFPAIKKNLENKDISIEDAHCPICSKCGSNFIKPDTVLFHEDLPDLFYYKFPKDFKKADLLIIAGTSLEVYPFASLPGKVGHSIPRFYVNKTMCKNKRKFNFATERDTFIEGDCQDFAMRLVEILGWDSSMKEYLENRCNVGKHGNFNETSNESKHNKT